MGAVVTGYEAPRCYLLRPAAEALQRVQASLRDSHFRLQVFDCYRPVRAVQHFVRWAADLEDQKTKPHYYPNIDKTGADPRLHSRTNRGTAAARRSTSRSLQCDAAGENASRWTWAHRSISSTRAPTLTTRASLPEQRANRQRLDQRWKAGRIPQLSDGMVALHADIRSRRRASPTTSGAVANITSADTAADRERGADTARGRCDW